MKIDRLELTNFRNHKRLRLNFDGGPVLISGPNGSGKSNVLEAMHLLSTTKSMRTGYDCEMISHDENFARVDGQTEVDGDQTSLEMQIIRSDIYENTSVKKVKINKVTKSLQKFAGTLNSVLFTPPDLELFSGTPTHRRRYIDSVIFQTDLPYKRAHSQYTKAVRQRNKLLEQIRESGKGKDLISLWDEKIVETGGVLQKKRDELFSHINEKLLTHVRELSDEKISHLVSYKKSIVSMERIEQYKEREVAAKTTLIGPHRDDFIVLLDGLDIAFFGSRGQQRAMLLALKLCEIDFIQEKTGHRPILLLDDIFSELDERHRKAIFGIVDKQQTIITSADSTNLPDKHFETVYLG